MDILGVRLVYVYVKVEAPTFFYPPVMAKNKILTFFAENF